MGVGRCAPNEGSGRFMILGSHGVGSVSFPGPLDDGPSPRPWRLKKLGLSGDGCVLYPLDKPRNRIVR
jgi:hypothetical protein